MFNDSKYTKYYFNIIASARLNTFEGYTEKHHIIPKCLGGDDSKDNLVRLSARQHFVCHKLLVKMVCGQAKYKMIEAVSIFSNNKNRKLTFNSRDISLIREANALTASARNKDNKNYLHRKPAAAELKALRSANAKKSRWINNGTIEKFTDCHEHFIANSGYVYGRLPFSEEWIKKTTANISHLHTPEVNKKKSKSLKGKSKSEQHRLKLLENFKNRDDITCEHCGVTCNNLNFYKYHGDNCKIIKPRAIHTCEHCSFETTSELNYKRWHGVNCKRINRS
jgi:hypothetical protein